MLLFKDACACIVALLAIAILVEYFGRWCYGRLQSVNIENCLKVETVPDLMQTSPLLYLGPLLGSPINLNLHQTLPKTFSSFFIGLLINLQHRKFLILIRR